MRKWIALGILIATLVMIASAQAQWVRVYGGGGTAIGLEAQ